MGSGAPRGLIEIKNYKDGKPGMVARRNQEFPKVTDENLKWMDGKKRANLSDDEIKKLEFFEPIDKKNKEKGYNYLKRVKAAFTAFKHQGLGKNEVEYPWDRKLHAKLNEKIYTCIFEEKYVVDKRLMETFEAENRYRYLRTQLGLEGLHSAPSDAIGLQEIEMGKDPTNVHIHEKLLAKLTDTHEEFEYTSSPKNDMHGRLYLNKEKFQVLEIDDFPEGMRVKVKTGRTGTVGRVGTILKRKNNSRSTKTIAVKLDKDDEETMISKDSLKALYSIRSKKFNAKKHDSEKDPAADLEELDHQTQDDTKLERTCGVVVPVKMGEQIVIFGSFHFKSGKEKKDVGQRSYDSFALLRAVKQLKQV